MPASTILRAGGAGGGRELAGVVGVQRDVDRLAGRLQGRDQLVGDHLRLDGRNAGVEAHHLHVVDPRQPGHHVAQAARRQDEAVAAGDDDLPDVRALGDVGHGGVQRLRRQRAQALGPDHLAAEAEPAVDRAGVVDLQQAAVGIAVDDPLDRRVGEVADRVGGLPRAGRDSSAVGRDELARDRVVRIGGVDQVGHGRRDRHGILRRHPLQRRQALGRDQAGVGQGLGAAKGPGGGHGVEGRHMGRKPRAWQLGAPPRA